MADWLILVAFDGLDRDGAGRHVRVGFGVRIVVPGQRHGGTGEEADDAWAIFWRFCPAAAKPSA